MTAGNNPVTHAGAAPKAGEQPGVAAPPDAYSPSTELRFLVPATKAFGIHPVEALRAD